MSKKSARKKTEASEFLATANQDVAKNEDATEAKGEKDSSNEAAASTEPQTVEAAVAVENKEPVKAKMLPRKFHKFQK